jgi:hypothetical protein
MNPNQNQHNMQAVQLPKQSHTSLIVALIMSILFVVALGFGVWAFIGKVENKSNLDEKIEAAAAVAVEKAEVAKEAEFAERDKNPFKSYTGSTTYGSLTYSFPRTWSVYTEENNSGKLLDFYAHPNVITGTAATNSFALRVQILDSSYDTLIAKYQKDAEKGTITVTAYRPEKVPSVLGARINGEIIKGKQGSMILLPQRDKTFIIWTESTDYVPDFENVIKTINFVP